MQSKGRRKDTATSISSKANGCSQLRLAESRNALRLESLTWTLSPFDFKPFAAPKMKRAKQPLPVTKKTQLVTQVLRDLREQDEPEVAVSTDHIPCKSHFE